MNIKLLNDLAKMPTKAHTTDAGWDLYAATSYDIEIEPHKSVMIGTGIAVELPIGYGGWILPRSGIACKRHLRPSNTPGLLDSDYRGEVMVSLFNDSDETQVVEAGERIAQMVVVPFYAGEFERVDELSETDRGNGGFGSSGTH